MYRLYFRCTTDFCEPNVAQNIFIRWNIVIVSESEPNYTKKSSLQMFEHTPLQHTTRHTAYLGTQHDVSFLGLTIPATAGNWIVLHKKDSRKSEGCFYVIMWDICFGFRAVTTQERVYSMKKS